jgi:hypothetical protein
MLAVLFVQSLAGSMILLSLAFGGVWISAVSIRAPSQER